MVPELKADWWKWITYVRLMHNPGRDFSRIHFGIDPVSTAANMLA